MPSKRARKSSSIRVKKPTSRKARPSRASAALRATAWYQAAARVIRISDGTIAHGQ
jgi:hypothetical protein